MEFEIVYPVPPGCAAPIPQPGSNPHQGILSPLSPRNAACHISGFGAGPLFFVEIGCAARGPHRQRNMKAKGKNRNE